MIKYILFRYLHILRGSAPTSATESHVHYLLFSHLNGTTIVILPLFTQHVNLLSLTRSRAYTSCWHGLKPRPKPNFASPTKRWSWRQIESSNDHREIMHGKWNALYRLRIGGFVELLNNVGNISVILLAEIEDMIQSLINLKQIGMMLITTYLLIHETKFNSISIVYKLYKRTFCSNHTRRSLKWGLTMWEVDRNRTQIHRCVPTSLLQSTF